MHTSVKNLKIYKCKILLIAQQQKLTCGLFAHNGRLLITFTPSFLFYRV